MTTKSILIAAVVVMVAMVLSVGADTDAAQYDFAWGVKDDDSGNMYSHTETRDDDVTRGAYYTLLPDGRLQKVSYYVDADSGYVATISYEQLRR